MVSAGFQVTKRKKGGRELGPWQLRVFVPKALQPKVGKKEVWRTLRTADRRTATLRVEETLAKIYAEWGLSGGDATATSPMTASSIRCVGRLRRWPARVADRVTG